MAALTAPAARAGEPGIRLQQRGHCPRPALLRRELGARFALSARASAATWSLRVERSAAGPLRLELRAPDGTLSLTRELRSEDCDALAPAVAIIAEVHFVQLSLPPARDPRRAARPAASRPARPPTPPPPPARRPAAPPRERQLSLALGGALDLAVSPLLARAAGQLDVAFRAWRAPVALRLAVLVDQPATQRGALDRVDLRQILTRLDAALRVDGARLWAQGALGVGVALSHARALDLPGEPTALRAGPLVAACVGGGVRMGAGLSLRAEITAHLYPIADRYTVSPFGEIGRSPRASLLFGLALQLDTVWRVEGIRENQ